MPSFVFLSITSFLFSFRFSLTFYSWSFSTEIFTLGDVDNDGNINASDALQDLRHSVNEIQLLGTAFSAGDVTKDGTINASDALQILRYSVGEIRSFD